MAKRKSSTPKSRRNSSFAARTATKVIDSTSNDAKHKEAENLNEPSTEIAQVSNNKTANPSISKDTIKKKRINCLEEIKMLQRTTRCLIPRAPFMRLVKELIQQRSSINMKISILAVDAMRE